jgi:protein TonB
MKKHAAFALLALLSWLMFAAALAPAQEPSEGSRKVVTKVIPQYPALARAVNIEGVVRADVVVAPSGKVKSVEVRGGHPLLARAAEDALRDWKWEAGSRETHENVELRFHP